MNNNFSFTVVLKDGTQKEFKSGEDIRAYYDRKEIFRVHLNKDNKRYPVYLEEIYFTLTPKNHGHLVNGAIG